MNKTTITFEIHDVTTHELLADNLPFDDLPELVYAYQLMLPTHQIEACYREVVVTERLHHIPRDDFKYDWYELLDDIIDNLYNS